jgi:hypothetical protein
MSVKRNEDGSINITNNNGSMAVGRMVLVSNDKKREPNSLMIVTITNQLK